MKTKNNVQKVILRSLAAVASLVLITYTVSANNFWKRIFTNNSFNHIAEVLVEKPGINSFHTVSPVDLTEWESDSGSGGEVLPVSESGRSDELISIYKEDFLVTEFEHPVRLEPWMLDESLFGPFETAAEKSLGIEDWMLQNAYWSY